MRSSVVVLFIGYCEGEHVKEGEMGSACGTYGGEGKHIQDCGGEN